MACKRSLHGSALPCPAGRSVPDRRRTGAPKASATGRDRTLGPCWVRGAAGSQGHGWSPAVTSGETEPQVGRPPGQAPRATPAARSDCGLGGHLLWHPSTLPTGSTCEVLWFGRPVRRVRADGRRRWDRPAGGLGRTGREHPGRTLAPGPRRWWAPAWDGLGTSRTGHG
jgi:hypothetical protein